MRPARFSCAVLPLLLALTLAAACGEDGAEGTEGESSTSEGASTTFGDETGDGDGDGDELLSCEAPTPCDPLEVGEGGDLGDAAQCVLAVLRDADTDAPQRVQYLNDMGDSVTNREINTGAQTREVLVQEWGHWNGSGNFVNPLMRCTLKPADFFQACIDSPDTDCDDPYSWYEACAEDPDALCPE